MTSDTDPVPLDATQVASVFEERAENLSKAELREWSADLPDDAAVLAKLRAPGAMLLSGPRGSGKSTLLRRAYFDMLEGDTVLPVYVNYAKSLALEPYFHRTANALSIFRQWLLAKIVVAIRESAEQLGREVPPDLAVRATWAEALIRALEVSRPPETILDPLAPSLALLLFEEWTTALRRHRCVLLLDDAAHAFSSQQQREFFEVFRALKSRSVSAKAAIYPGLTSYSPNFHIGHDAQLVEAWCDPTHATYLPVMRSIFARRFPLELRQRMAGRESLVDYLALASFGIPRAFLTMIGALVGVDDVAQTPTRSAADSAIESQALSVRSVFSSLADKLPRFKNFVLVGIELDRALIQLLREFNARKELNQKAVAVAIAEPLGQELERILSFMEYAGLVRSVGPFKRGNRGTYQRYTVHYSLAITDGALALGKSASLQNIIAALQSPDAHAFAHTRGATLLGADFANRCTLDLPPCQRCGAARTFDEARFCVACGAPLTNASVYEELLNAPIDRLPLTERKIADLKKHTTIRTVQDVILDEESRLIRSVPWVGPVWAKRIHNAAEEFASV
jgi:hypothetical protein